jgi:hypothetical protein
LRAVFEAPGLVAGFDDLAVMGEPVEQRGGQHMLVCLTNLTARLHGVVRAIQVDVEGDISVVRPNGAGPIDAMEGLENLATWANGGRIYHPSSPYHSYP